MCSLNIKCKLSFPGMGSLCCTVFSLGRVTQQDGSEAGRQVQSKTLESGLWTYGQERFPKPGWQRDMMPLRRMKSSGAAATWLCEGCKPIAERAKQKVGGRWTVGSQAWDVSSAADRRDPAGVGTAGPGVAWGARECNQTLSRPAGHGHLGTTRPSSSS